MGETRQPDSATLTRFWDLSSDLLAVADLDGRFEHVNRRWEEVTGHSVEALTSRPFLHFVHPDDRERTAREAAAMADTGRSSASFENRYLCADGSVVWLLWSATTAPQEERIYAVATDITARRRSEACLAVMREAAEASNQAEQLEPALRRATDEVCATTGWSVGHGWLPDPDDPERLVPSGSWVVRDGADFGVLQRATSELTFRAGEGLPGRVLAAGEPQWVTDVQVEPWFVRARGVDPGVHAALAFPVRAREQVVAVLEFFAREPLPPDEEVLEVMAQVGIQLGRVHERAEIAAAEQRAVETERRFLSMLTHELRSPLVSIKGFVDLLLERWAELAEPNKVDFLERAGRSANRLHRLVQEFLSLAQRHTQGFEPRLQPVDVREQVDRVVDELALAGTELRTEVSEGLRATADVDFLDQILINLITNAQRHGAPPIEVCAEPTGDGARVAVRDHGPGVPDEFVAHLFKRFARADRGGEGTGLGLSVARDLARAQGGHLYYEAAEGGGSRFVVTLTAAPPRSV